LAAVLGPHPRKLAQFVLIPAASGRLMEHRVELRRIHRRHLLSDPLRTEPARHIEDRHGVQDYRPDKRTRERWQLRRGMSLEDELEKRRRVLEEMRRRVRSGIAAVRFQR
jgi:hypothetical protein